MQQKLATFKVSNFGSLNTVDSAWAMGPNMTPDALNVYTDGGVIRKRPAIKRRHTVQLPVNATGSSNPAQDFSQTAFIWQNTTPGTYTTIYEQDWEAHADGTDLDTLVDAGDASGNAWSQLDATSGVLAVTTDLPVPRGAKSIWWNANPGAGLVTRYRRTLSAPISDGTISVLLNSQSLPVQHDQSFSICNSDTDVTGEAIRVRTVWQSSSPVIANVTVTAATGGATTGINVKDNGPLQLTIKIKPDGTYRLTIQTLLGVDMITPMSGTMSNSIKSIDRIIMRNSNGSGSVSAFKWDYLTVSSFYQASASTKIFIVQGGFDGVAPRIVRGEANDPATAWTVVGNISANTNTHVFPVPFKSYYTFPSVPAAIPKAMTSALSIYTLGANKVAGATDPVASSDAAAYNRMLMSSIANGLIQFSYIDDGESYLSSDTLTMGQFQWTPSALWDLGRFCVVVTESGVYAVSGFGRGSNRADRLNSTVGAGDYHCMAGNDSVAFFPGHSASTRMIDNPGRNPYTGIYQVTPDGNVSSISDDIASSSLFNNTSVWTGRRAEVSLSYDTARDYLYVLAPRHFPVDAATAAGTGSQVFVYHNGGWAKWTFPTSMYVSYIYPHSLKPPSATLSADYATETILGGSGVDGYRYVYNFDEGYMGQATAVQAKDVDGSGTYTNSISAYWTTPVYTVYDPGQSDKIHHMYLFGDQTSGGGCTVEYKADDEASWHVCGGGSTTWALQRQGIKVEIGVTCRVIQFKFTFAADSVEPEVHGFSVDFEPISRQP